MSRRNRRHTRRYNGQYYQNLKVLDVKGQLLFMHRQDKIDWYLEKNLADPVEYDEDGNVSVIQLNFETKGMGVRNHPYLSLEKKNECVVCGGDEDLSMHHVVPWCFRRHFPIKFRDKNSFDCLLLCRKCHVGYEALADIYKEGLNQQYLNGMLSKSATYATTLLQFGNQIPEERKIELRNFIKQEAQENGWEYESFQALLRELTKTTLSNWTETVVKKILKADHMLQFIQNWRHHFVDTMKPKNLSPEWRVDADYRGMPVN